VPMRLEFSGDHHLSEVVILFSKQHTKLCSSYQNYKTLQVFCLAVVTFLPVENILNTDG